MGLTPKFSASQVRSKLESDYQRIHKAIIFTLSYLGEQCVNEAKSSGQYNDRTGNLRSSIGYIIVDNGKVIDDSFSGSFKSSNVTTSRLRSKSAKVRSVQNGTETGRSIAYQLAVRMKGIALIVVAGMNYALYVESKGLNVLTTAEMLCKRELKPMMKQLEQKIAKRFK